MAKIISVLLGAGVSVPAGLPSTEEMTKKLLKGDSFNLDSPLQYDTELIIKYLNIIYEKIYSFYRNKSVTYEDIYYVTTQIKDFLKEYENPIVSSFARDVLKDLDQYYEKYYCSINFKKIHMDSSLEENINLESEKILSSIAESAARYINSLIVQFLKKENPETAQLNFIKEIVDDSDVNILNIFTLNHDLIIEKYLKENSIKYYDGFGIDKKKNQGLRVWKSSFMNSQEKVRLLKLHGSIDWYRMRGEHFNTYQGFYFAQIDNDCKIKSLIEKKDPLILTGRFNKIIEYNRSIYVDLHYSFYRLLANTDIILISGYSFNDKGINSWLIDWMYAVRDHKIIFVHPRPDDCIKNARYGIQHHWQIWQREKKINNIIIPIEDFSWEKHFKD